MLRKVLILSPFFIWWSWGLVKPFTQDLLAGEGPHFKLNRGSPEFRAYASSCSTALLCASLPLFFLPPNPSRTLAFSSSLVLSLHKQRHIEPETEHIAKEKEGALDHIDSQISKCFLCIFFFVPLRQLYKAGLKWFYCHPIEKEMVTQRCDMTGSISRGTLNLLWLYFSPPSPHWHLFPLGSQAAVRCSLKWDKEEATRSLKHRNLLHCPRVQGPAVLLFRPGSPVGPIGTDHQNGGGLGWMIVVEEVAGARTHPVPFEEGWQAGLGREMSLAFE